MPFSALGLSPALVQPLTRLGYTQPTPVQAAAIPIALGGADLVARAETGTGKTAAFALPMIDRLLVRGQRNNRASAPRGLVLVPTRELAVQVDRAVARYGAGAHVRTTVLVGGVGIGGQIHGLRRGIDIVVATPGRLVDHVERRTIDLSAVEIVVIDEADRMLDVGFLPVLRRLVAMLPRGRQTLLFSATMPPEVMDLARQMTRDPKHIEMSPAIVAPKIEHHMHVVSEDRKGDLLAAVLKKAPVGQAIVFCQTKRGSDRVARRLEAAGVQAAVIHGNKSQNARTRALDSFRSGRVRVLVATDLAARGLDIAQLPLVVNYNLPLVAEDYVHRVGRTGRAGCSGRAVSLVSSVDRDRLRGIQRLLPTGIERIAVEGFDSSDPLPERPQSQDGRHSAGAAPSWRRPRFGRSGRPHAAAGPVKARRF